MIGKIGDLTAMTNEELLDWTMNKAARVGQGKSSNIFGSNQGRDELLRRLSAAPQVQGEQLAQQFHEIYERLAELAGYKTRKESAKPWAEVPGKNKSLMIAVCEEILASHGLREQGYKQASTAEPIAEAAAAAPSVAQAKCPKCGAPMDQKTWERGDRNAVCVNLHVFPICHVADFAQFFSSPSASQDSKPSCHICGEGMDKGFICGKCGAHTGVAQAAPAVLSERVSSPRSAEAEHAVSTLDCICNGNWRQIVNESESQIGKLFTDSKGRRFRFFGIVHGSDDYYYGMYSKVEGMRLLSCVSDLTGWDFNILDEELGAALPGQPSPAPGLQSCKPNSIMKQVMWCDTHNRSYSECKNELESGSFQPSEGLEQELRASLSALIARIENAGIEDFCPSEMESARNLLARHFSGGKGAKCARCNQPAGQFVRHCHQCGAPLCDHVCEEWHLEKACKPALSGSAVEEPQAKNYYEAADGRRQCLIASHKTGCKCFEDAPEPLCANPECGHGKRSHKFENTQRGDICRNCRCNQWLEPEPAPARKEESAE